MNVLRLITIAVLAMSLTACTESGEPTPGYHLDRDHQARAHDSRVQQLILHYTGENNANSLAILTGPRVSSHYLLPARQSPEPPSVYQLVDESRRAWHAGASYWRGQRGLNATSIGIEIVNGGPALDFATLQRRLDEKEPGAIPWSRYPPAQIETLIRLMRDIVERHDIAPENILAHADVAPERKIDPGPAFPWRALYQAGLGAWPDEADVARYRRLFTTRPPELERFQAALAEWGYGLAPTGKLDARTRAVLRAFQMHFRPADYRGLPDDESAAILWALLEKYRPDALSRLSPTRATDEP